ncbi:MAG: MarR family winged helix-turn-helix transcriptional regulator [Burkholderiaceae bacterium]
MTAARTSPSRRPPSAVTAAEPALPKGCTSFKLRQLARRVGRHYDQQVATVGLKTTQYSLLSHIAQLGPLRPSDLAARMGLEPSTLTRNLAPLVAQGWVEVLAGQDGRSRSVTLTATGRAKRNEAQRAWKQAQLALNQRLGVERVAQLHELIDACLADLDAPLGEADNEPDA